MRLRTRAAFPADFSAPPTPDLDDLRRGAHKLSTLPLEGEAQFARAREVIFTYGIFDPNRLLFAIEGGRAREGGVILQRVLLGPVAWDMSVRILEVIDRPQLAQMSYATLPGHLEWGIATFRATPSAFEIETWSRPGHWLSKLGLPFVRWMQKNETRKAIERVRIATRR
jgi:uncharacterized protein (UPF0548 family)